MKIINVGGGTSYFNNLDIGNYAYLIPFVETESEIFLKSIIPSHLSHAADPDCIWLVVVSELSDEHRVAAYFINETMFIIDAPGPVTGECVLEGFWFADAFKWRTLDIFD